MERLWSRAVATSGNCWTKVGLGEESLPVSFKNFLKPWFFIDVRQGRVSCFYFASKFVD
jgi:hypothetical protein